MLILVVVVLFTFFSCISSSIKIFDYGSSENLIFCPQSAQQRFQDEPPFQFGNEDESLLLDENIEDIGGGMDIGMGGLNYLDILRMDAGGGTEPDPLDDGQNGPQENMSQPSSPTPGYSGGGGGRCTSPSQHNGQALSNGKVLADPNEDDTATLQQQPLALGYYISTAGMLHILPPLFYSIEVTRI